MFDVEGHLELGSTFSVPLLIHTCAYPEFLPEHFDTETTIPTASKLVHHADGKKHYHCQCFYKI